MEASVAVLLIVLVALAVVCWRLLAKRAGTTTAAELARMDGPAFERWLLVLFESLGFSVRSTGGKYDFGADLILAKDGSTIAVQAKARKDYASIAAVQQVLGARFYYGCDRALAVTNAVFSKPAVALAKRADVELWDRGQLLEAAAAARGEST